MQALDSTNGTYCKPYARVFKTRTACKIYVGLFKDHPSLKVSLNNLLKTFFVFYANQKN